MVSFGWTFKKNWKAMALWFIGHKLSRTSIFLTTCLSEALFSERFALPNSNIPHLVIADTDTLHKKGLEKLKKQCRKNEIPIIYICSEVNDKIIKEREKNAIGIFKKPFNSDNIIELIDEYFKR